MSTLSCHDISLDQAQAAVKAAVAKAEAIDTLMDIAVVDAGGNLKAFARMDGAWLGSIDIAQKKARTARYFDMNTGDIGGLSQPGKPLFNIEHSNGGLITFPGGVPIRINGQVIGATNRLGEYAAERPVHFQEVFATLYKSLGIDVGNFTLPDFQGRPTYLVDANQHRPISELI